MKRRRAEGRGLVMLTPTGETLAKLKQLVELTCGTAKEKTETILRRGVGTALKEAQARADRLGEIYRAAKPYLPYARFLRNPGTEFRIGDRVLREPDFRPLAGALGAFYDEARRWGWSRKRGDRFLAKAAARSAPAPESALK